MSDHDFQLKVIESLGSLQTDMTAVKEHLRTLNGKVVKHEQELAERRGAEKESRRWANHLVPVVRWAAGVLIGVIITLALNHSSLFSTTQPVPAPAAIVQQAK